MASSAGDPAFYAREVTEARRFHFGPPAGIPGAPWSVVAGGRETLAPGYRVTRDGFPCLAIEFVRSGRGQLVLAGKSHQLGEGSVFSYGPGIAHDIQPDPGTLMLKYFVDFDGPGALPWLEEAGLAPGTCAATAVPEAVAAIFESLLTDSDQEPALAARFARVHLDHLVLRLAASRLESAGEGTMAHATYIRCRRWMEAHAFEIKQVGQIARACHLDPAYLTRLFRRFARESPYRVLMRIRMQRAGELLLAPGASIQSVADQLGFADAFHFSRSFKRIVGVPPTTFRRHGGRPG